MHPLIPVARNVVSRLWAQYRAAVPDARRVEDALRARGETWNEDHLALRTLPGAHCGAHVLEKAFALLGYERRDSFRFEDKQLSAFWMSPPLAPGARSAQVLPKVFISELIPDAFSGPFREVIRRAVDQVVGDPIDALARLAQQVRTGDASGAGAQREEGVRDGGREGGPESGRARELEDGLVALLSNGPAWARPMSSDYEVLRKESEYAAWTLAFGSRPNHFTVSVHLMSSFASLEDFNSYVISALNIPMNTSGGGLIKGTKAVRLEQSATLAAEATVAFQDKAARLPYAFIEFAFRHPREGRAHDGAWDSYYQGFEVKNADKIFESTDVRGATAS